MAWGSLSPPWRAEGWGEGCVTERVGLATPARAARLLHELARAHADTLAPHRALSPSVDGERGKNLAAAYS